jgi:hypothetical protein
MTPDQSKPIFNPGLFLHDLRSALAQAHHPIFPQPAWHQALRRCCQRDDSRRMSSYYAALDLYRIQIDYRQHLGDSSAAKMNGQILHLAPSTPDIESPILLPTKN